MILQWNADHIFDQDPSALQEDFPGGSAGKVSASNVGDPGFNSWVGKIPWRRESLLTPVFLPGESSWTEEPGGLQSMGSQTVIHN